MDIRNYPDYYLGPEFQNDNSIFRIIAETLALSRSQGVDDAFKSELLFLMTEFTSTFRLMRHVQSKRSIYTASASDNHALEDDSNEFREKCFLVDNVKEQLSTFVDYCADRVEKLY